MVRSMFTRVAMIRRNFVKAAALAVLGTGASRRARSQSGSLSREDWELIARIGDIVLPTSLGADRRRKAVDAFATWLEEYQAGVPMSYGYGNELKLGVVPPSPVLRYSVHLKRLMKLAKTKGSNFTSLSLADKKSLLEAALVEANVTELPERPNGQHVATDLLSHYYNSSDGNDFLFKASIRVSECRGLGTSEDRPPAIS